MEDDAIGETLKAACRGDSAAFERLAAAHRPRLEALIRRRLGSKLRPRIETDDIVQETLLRALRSLSVYEDEGPGSFFRWLGGIANHVILEAAKREKRDIILPLDAEPAAAVISQSKATARDERFERLQRSLDGLSPDHRLVIVLARIERLPMKEVAVRMGRTPEAATQLLWRALQKLKASFGHTDSLHLPPRSLSDGGSP
jgi:RNA polymerase sigma-70 factor (ECF subfamily)